MPVIYKKNCELCSKYYESPAKLFCSQRCYLRFTKTDKEYKEKSRKKFLIIREKYQKRTGKPLGFQKGNENPAKHPTAKQRMSQFKKGVPLSKTHRKKQSITMRRTLKRPEMREKWSKVATGRKHSKETIEKLKLAHAQKPKSRNGIQHSQHHDYK